MRWAPTVAAAMVLFVAGVMFYVAMQAETGTSQVSSRGQYEPDPGKESASAPDAADGRLAYGRDGDFDQAMVKEQLVRTRRELDELRRQFKQAQAPDSAADLAESEAPSEGETGLRAGGGAGEPTMEPMADAPARRPRAAAPMDSRRGDRSDEGKRADALGMELKTARQENRRLRMQLAETDEAFGQVKADVKKLQAEKGRLAERLDELARLGQQVAQLRKEVTETRQTLRIAARTKAAAEPEPRAARRRADLQDDVDTAVQAAPPAGQNQKMGRDEREALLSRVEALEDRTRRLQEAFSVAYRMAASGGRDGLAGWQIASVRAELVKRSAQVRPSAATEKTRKLIDRIEFVLLRLEQIDPTDAAARRKLVDIIDKGDLVEMIDARLGAEAEPRNVQSWLLEARAVLEGISDVG
jgi:hypothetical protein